MPNRNWAQPTIMVTYPLNQSPKCIKTTVTLYKLWYGTKPKYGHLWPFGFLTYIRIQKGELEDQKFDSRVGKCVFIGYNSSTRMLRVFYPCSRSIIYLRDVVPFENRFYCKDVADQAEAEDDSVSTPEYENIADASEEQFYRILRQQNGDNTEKGISTNNG